MFPAASRRASTPPANASIPCLSLKWVRERDMNFKLCSTSFSLESEGIEHR